MGLQSDSWEITVSNTSQLLPMPLGGSALFNPPAASLGGSALLKPPDASWWVRITQDVEMVKSQPCSAHVAPQSHVVADVSWHFF